MVDQGVHLRVIQEIVWHSDVRVTERYTHIASSAETATRNATNSPLGDLPEGENG